MLTVHLLNAVFINGAPHTRIKGDEDFVSYTGNTWRGDGILVKENKVWTFIPMSNVSHIQEQRP